MTIQYMAWIDRTCSYMNELRTSTCDPCTHGNVHIEKLSYLDFFDYYEHVKLV